MTRVYGVLLTDEGWAELSSALVAHISTGPIGRYVYCNSVKPDGPFCVLEVHSDNPDGSTFDAEISIPHRFVKLVVSAADKRQIGFVAS